MFRHKPSEVTVYNTSNFNLTSRMLRHTSSEVAVYNTSKQLTCVSCLSLQFVSRVFLIKLRWPKKNIFFETNTYFSDHKTFLDYMLVFS